jgi:hypothetical protein
VPNLPQSPAEQNYVRALYYLTKTQDPSRPVVGNDGWESVTTDIIGIHDYEDDPERMARRYYSPEVPKLLARERPGGRALVLAAVTADQPIVLSEFGGIAVVDREQDCWGYSVCTTTQHFEERFRELLRVVRSLELFAGFCYTQFCDTHQEANGLLRFDRSPKIPLKAIAEATTGSATGVPRNELSPEIRATPADEDKPAR